jgi:putative heme-binding domain-containing protein
MRRLLLAAAWVAPTLATADEPFRAPEPGPQRFVEAPRPVLAWPAGPMEVRVAFDRAIDPGAAAAPEGAAIAYGPHVRAGDRSETSKPPDQAGPQEAAPRGALRIAAAKREADGRTLVLVTDPHPFEARYTLTLRGLKPPGDSGPGATAEIGYSLNGAEMSWTEPDAAEPALTLWWPHLDPAVVRARTAGSVEHERAFERIARPGRLTLRSFVSLPEGRVVVRLHSSTRIEEAALNGEPAELTEDGRRAELKGEANGQPVELLVGLTTGATREPLSLSVSLSTAGDPAQRPLPRERLTVPWSPGPPLPSAPPPPLPPALAGGDARRGEAVFFSDESKCSACHKVRGRGGEIGPDLSDLEERDADSIVRDIQDPSAVINPDYVPYTVALKDGRVLVGVVRAEGAEALRVLDTNAQATTVPRAEIADMQPSRTSIMPVGLAGALGEDRLRDLVAFLTARPKPESSAARGGGQSRGCETVYLRSSR